jgi:hypothetical protein
MLNAVTLEVSLNGTHQYTSIQTAVNVSNNGDIVLVHPGRYFENIDFIGKNISICSEFVNNPDWSIVENTIIDGNQQSSCVIVMSGEQNAVVNGFTLSNGIGYGNEGYRYGGGIFIWEESVLAVNNSIIDNNSSITSGGISCTGSSTLILSGNIIRNNRSIYQGGGIGVYGATVYFDPVNLNSIYNNYGDVQDIFLHNVTCNDIVLDTLSVNMSEPDGFFVSYYAPPLNTNPIPNISVQNNFFTQVDADLYVSPDGDDTNDGLTPETALRTIAFANRIVQPDSLNPNTVYLLPGTYSAGLNNQFFPIALQSNTKMLGAGGEPEDVVIGDEWGMNQVIPRNSRNNEIGNFTMTHAEMGTEIAFGSGRCSDLYIHDIVFSNNNCESPGIYLSSCYDCVIENISVKNVTNNNIRLRCIYIYECQGIVLNGITIDNIVNTAEECITSFVNFSSSDVRVNNFILSNSTDNGSGLIFQYTNPNYSTINGNIELNNLLVYNNTSLSNSAPLVNFHSYFEECFINNMTIAHNTGPTLITRFAGDYTIRNSIMYNPQGACEMGVWVPANGDPYPLWSNVDLDYSLVRNGLSGVAGSTNPNNNVTWGSHNIDTDPLFRGDVAGNIPIGDPRWIQLMPNSPCVDAGTPDTLGMNLPTTDITGNPRVWNGIIDMGAHEYNPTVDNAENTIPAIPDEIVVSHFPNPIFLNGNNSRSVFIEFTLPKKPKKQPTLEIYNIKGQKVRNIKITQSLSQLVRSAGLSSEDKQSGEYYSQIWDCRDDNRTPVSSGIYFYKVSSEGKEALGKMMVLK